jgi:hypothetical protein
MQRKYFFVILFSLTAVFTSICQIHIWTGDGGDEDWFNAANWDVGTVPTSSSDVIIDNGFSVILATNPVTVTNIGLFDTATLTLENDFTAFEQFRIGPDATVLWKNGGFIGGAIVQNNGSMILTNNDEKHISGANLENNGFIEINNIGFLRLNDGAVITNTAGAIFEINGTAALSPLTGTAVFNNEGIVRKIDTGISGASYMIFEMNNWGIIDVGEDQTFLFLSALGALNNFEDGKIQGKGVYDITAPFTCPGTISPGDNEIATLEFVNNFDLSPETKLEFDLGGTNAGEYDVIAVTGFPNLQGNILVTAVNNLELNDEFTIITANDITSCNFPPQITTANGVFPFYTFDVICNNDAVVLKVADIIVLGQNDFSSEEIEFTVQPNPVKETMHFEFQASNGFSMPSEKLSVKIYDVLGQEVRNFQGFSETNSSFPRENIASGLYFVHLTSENKILASAKMLVD